MKLILTATEFQALNTSLEAHGVRVPTAWGHHQHWAIGPINETDITGSVQIIVSENLALKCIVIAAKYALLVRSFLVAIKQFVSTNEPDIKLAAAMAAERYVKD